MTTTFERVAEFHRKFGLDATQPGQMPRAPTLGPDEALVREAEAHLVLARDTLRRGRGVAPYRLGFLAEELAELAGAYLDRDVTQIADALADLDYVVAGTAHLHGIPHDAVVAEVHAANMRKVRGATPGRAHELDVRKPPGWEPPDVAGVLGLRPRRFTGPAG